MTNQRLCVGSLCWYLTTARDLVWLLLVSSMVIPAVSLAQRVPTGYHRIASQYQIPATVLYAVALTESGKAIDQRIYRPWPWTLNVAGQPKRFTSQSAACLEIKRQLTKGIRSIDIGLMILVHALVTKKGDLKQDSMLGCRSGLLKDRVRRCD